MYSKPKFWRVTFIQHVKKEGKLNTLKTQNIKQTKKKNEEIQLNFILQIHYYIQYQVKLVKLQIKPKWTTK